MKILIACEFSGIVRDAFIARGHNAVSCDLLPTERPGPHIQGDVSPLLKQDWDMIIAFPPCTYLCNSGVRWLYNADGSHNFERWVKMKDGALFFKKFLECDCEKVAVENPRMHKYAVEIIGSRADQFIHPWQFGHGETKATGLHLIGLPKLEPSNIVDGREARIHRMPPGPERPKLRSKTLTGFGDAMASQWGKT